MNSVYNVCQFSRTWSLCGILPMCLRCWLDWGQLRFSWLPSCQSMFRKRGVCVHQLVSLLPRIFRVKLQWDGRLYYLGKLQRTRRLRHFRDTGCIMQVFQVKEVYALTLNNLPLESIGNREQAVGRIIDTCLNLFLIFLLRQVLRWVYWT